MSHGGSPRSSRELKVWSEFSYSHFFEGFLRREDFRFRKMFGGLALYLKDRNVSVLCEDPRDVSWKGVKYGFPLWNGVLIPTFREQHESLKNELSSAIEHPVLGKWLYLRAEHPEFENEIEKLVQKISKGDPRIGIASAAKKATKKRQKNLR